MSCLRSLAVSAASLLMGCMSVSDGSDATTEPEVGEAAARVYAVANPPFPDNYLNVRNGPGFSYSTVRQIPRGQYINVVCAAMGDYVRGTRRWYQLSDGTFVTAAGAQAWGVPQCGGFGFGQGGGSGFGQHGP